MYKNNDIFMIEPSINGCIAVPDGLFTLLSFIVYNMISNVKDFISRVCAYYVHYTIINSAYIFAFIVQMKHYKYQWILPLYN